jgi:hypothetical protein
VRLVSGRVAQESRARSLRFDVLQERLQGSRRLAALMDKEGAVKKELEAIMEKLQNRGCSLDTIGYCGAVGFTFQVHHSRLVKNF